MKFIQEENIPSWYKLSIDTSRMILTVMVHANAFRKILQTSKEQIRNFQDAFNLGDFDKGPVNYFGYEKCATVLVRYPWFFLQIQLPEFALLTCEYCEGKPLETPSGSCFFCNHSGFEQKANHHKANAICASLSLLFRRISFLEHETDSDSFQTMTIATSCLSDCNDGFAMSGVISRFGAEALKKCSPLLAEEAMRKAHSFMTGDTASEKYRARIESGQISLTCFGNACGIDPTDSHKNGGYDFQSHNMGSPFQQLTILCGLASLQDQMKKGDSYA